MKHRRLGRMVPLLVGIVVIAASCSSQTTTPTPARTSTPTPVTASPSATATLTPVATSSLPTAAPSVAPTAVACGSPGQSPCPTFGIGIARNVPFTPPVVCGNGTTCQVQLDVFYPAPGSSGGPWPTVVIIPGGPEPLGGRAGFAGLAIRVAQEGVVVFVADYRSMPTQDAGYPQTFEDVACAIRTARESTPTYGGDPSTITLAGSSFGGWVGAVVALTPQGFPLDATDCLAQSGSGQPDAYAGIAGIYSLDQIAPSYLTGFFGGTRQQKPGIWGAGDPYALLNANRNGTTPFRLVAGSKDTVGKAISEQTFVAALKAAGYDATLTMIPGANHAAVFESPVASQVIVELAKSVG